VTGAIAKSHLCPIVIKKLPKSPITLVAEHHIRGNSPMWKIPVSVLCLAALPLLGCAGDYTARQTAAVPAAVNSGPGYYQAAAYQTAAPRAHATGPAAPAAVLVFLPGAGAVASEPALWEAEGFDVVMPPADIYRLVADQEAAMARLIASAQALADAPIWVVGPSPAIEAAMPEFGRGISGLIVTSASSPTVSCSESFSYYDPGTGAPPQVQVKRSGNCGPGLPTIAPRQPSVVQPPPGPHQNRPPIIEASAGPKNLPPAAQVRHLAQLIKSMPPS
jgi:hypothetical protein